MRSSSKVRRRGQCVEDETLELDSGATPSAKRTQPSCRTFPADAASRVRNGSCPSIWFAVVRRASGQKYKKTLQVRVVPSGRLFFLGSGSSPCLVLTP